MWCYQCPVGCGVALTACAFLILIVFHRPSVVQGGREGGGREERGREREEGGRREGGRERGREGEGGGRRE